MLSWIRRQQKIAKDIAEEIDKTIDSLRCGYLSDTQVDFIEKVITKHLQIVPRYMNSVIEEGNWTLGCKMSALFVEEEPPTHNGGSPISDQLTTEMLAEQD